MKVKATTCSVDGLNSGQFHTENSHPEHHSDCDTQRVTNDCKNHDAGKAKEVSFCVDENGLDTAIFIPELGEGDYVDFNDAKCDAINYLQHIIDEHQSLIDQLADVTTFEKYIESQESNAR